MLHKWDAIRSPMQDFILDPDLLSRIPLPAQTVLDVSCGSDELVAAYRRVNPNMPVRNRARSVGRRTGRLLPAGGVHRRR